jgi:plastin-1
MMRFHVLSVLKGIAGKTGKEVTDQDIINWANEMAKKGGKSSSISSFKDSSLRTSHFLIDVLDAMRPGSIDQTLVTPGVDDKDALQNAKYAISLARKFGATIFLLPEDIVEVKPKMILTFVGSIMAVALKS